MASLIFPTAFENYKSKTWFKHQYPQGDMYWVMAACLMITYLQQLLSTSSKLFHT